MSEEQLNALLAKLKVNAALREKLQSATEIDAFLAIAKEAGLEVSNWDWINHSKGIETLNDTDLESIAEGGKISNHDETWCTKCGTGYNDSCCGKG